MSCFKTSEASTKNKLFQEKLIDQYLNILDLGKFRARVTELSNYASSKYGITERLFYDEQNGTKAVPNKKAFQLIDYKKGIKYPENEWVEKFIPELGEEYWKQTYLKSRLPDEEDFKGVEIPTVSNKFKPDLFNLYHGTNKVDIDEHGNLKLIPSGNFQNKTSSISFTQIPVVAQDYMLRKSGNYIIKIKNSVLHNLEKENEEEFAINTDKPIVIKKGDYEVLNVPTISHQMERIYRRRSEIMYNDILSKKLSDIELLRDAYDSEFSSMTESELNDYDDGYRERTPSWYMSDISVRNMAMQRIAGELLSKITKDWLIDNFAVYFAQYLNADAEQGDSVMTYDKQDPFIFEQDVHSKIMVGNRQFGDSLLSSIFNDKSYSKSEQQEIIEKIRKKVISLYNPNTEKYNVPEKKEQQSSIAFKDEWIIFENNQWVVYHREIGVLDRFDTKEEAAAFLGVTVDNNYFYQTQSQSRKQITLEVKEQLLGFLKAVNPDFRVEVIDNLSVNGLTNLVDFSISLKKGKESALAEETAHVFLELLTDKNLLKDLLGDVVRTKMYSQVVKEYGQLYGMDYEKLKREAAAKLISLYIQDKEAFNYWSGSEQLTNNLESLIKRFFNWLKRNFKNPYSKAALRILKGSTQGIDTAIANQSSIYYQIDPERFQTIDVKDIKRYDKIFVNLNNTVLDYKNYQAPKAIKSRFFGDTNLLPQLEEFYSKANLTKLGRELKDKMDIIGSHRVIFFTDMPITDALVTRIEDEFGQVSIVRTGYNIVQTLFDEFGNPVDTLISGSQKEDLFNKIVREFPNANMLFVDNQSSSIINNSSPNLETRLYSNDNAKYTDVQTLLNQENQNKRVKEFSQDVINELSKVNKDSLLPLVKQSMNMVRNAINKIQDGEKFEELGEVFKDEYGNVTVPLYKDAYKMERLLEDTDTFEQGLISFVNTVESTIDFFSRANTNDYSAIRELLKGNEEDVDKAIKETAILMRMMLSWEQWIEGLQPYINDTKVINKVVATFRQELEKARTKLNKIAVDSLSLSLEEQWKPHNEAKLKLYKDGIITKDQYENSIYTAQKLADWLYGLHGDANSVSSLFENALMIKEPVIQAISRRIEKSMIGSGYEALEKNVPIMRELWDLGEKIGLGDEEIGNKLTFTDKENYWEDGEMKQRDTTYLLNKWQGVWVKEKKENDLKVLYTKLIEAKNRGEDTTALELEYKNSKEELSRWMDDNWYEEVTPDAKNIYKIFGIDDDQMDMAKAAQKEIYDQLSEQTTLLHSPGLSEQTELNINQNIERLVRELRLLRNEYTEDGELKTGDELIIAQKLKQKSLIDRQIYDYEIDKGGFLNAIKEQILSIGDESVRSISTSLLNTENLSELKRFADLHAPQVFVDWLDRNTITKFSDSFYEERGRLIEKIKEITGTNQVVDAIWKELTNSTSFLRDKDKVFDASDSTPKIQQLVRDYEEALEQLKDDEPNPRIIPFIQRLSEIQGKRPTDHYNELMYDFLKDVLPGISSSTDYRELINSQEFRNEFDSLPQDFKEWFQRNHFYKDVWDEALQEKIIKIVPTYIWMKIEPTGSKDILVVPGWKYNKRVLKDEATVEYEGLSKDLVLKTPKIDWTTWNPIEKKWLPKSDQFKNKEYERLEKSNDLKDKLLFEYLTKITKYQLDTQIGAGRDSRLGFKIPYFAKKYTEGGALNRAWKAATERLNPREEGTGAEETKKKAGIWKRLLAYSGVETPEQEIQNVRTDYLGNTIKTVYTPYTQYLPPNETTKNLVLSITNYAAGVEKVKALVNDIPQLTLLEQVFEQFQPKKEGTLNQYGQQVDAASNNRLKLLQFIIDKTLYANFKEFELERGIDKFAVGIRKMAVIGSQSDLNIPNAVKNWLQGQFMNLVFANNKGWATRRSVLKAARSYKTSYANFVYELGKKDKSIDFNIISWFNPLLEKRTADYSRDARGTELQDRVNITGSYFSATASEFSVMATLLYSHLYNQKVTIDGKEATLYDAFTLTNGVLSIKPNTYIGERLLTRDYLEELKLKFKVMMEDVQGKQWNQTMAQRYTTWASMEFFKKFFITMFRKRFGFKRENIELGEMEGMYQTLFKYLIRSLQGFIDGTNYNQALTPDEKERLASARDEIILSISTLFLLLYGFGFDADDKDKYKKLKDNTWLENMALLVALNTKRETDALVPIPFTTIQQSVYPPVLNETYNFITSPFVGFTVVQEARKMLDALIMLATDNDKAYYDRDMPAYLIERGDSKFEHYIKQVLQIDNFLYQTSPEAKIQVIVQSQNK